MSASIHLSPAGPCQDEVLNKALGWHFTAPIRVEDLLSPARGAILRGYDKRKGKPLGVYTEITGYAVSLLTFLLRSKDEPHLRHAAREAAEYLLRIQAPGGAYPDQPHPADPTMSKRLYTFDTGVCIVGMVRLAREAREKRYLESAIAAGRWLLSMQRPDGSFCAMQLEDGSDQDPGGFFGDGSCIHAKNAIALLELHAMTGGEELRDAAIKACQHTLTLQASDGAFWSTSEKRCVFTHAHCYACEGLLFAGSLLGEDRFTAAARRGVKWLESNQQPDGGWLSHYKMSAWSPRGMIDAIWRPKPSDAAAQAARLFCLIDRDHEVHLHAALRFLAQCQDFEGGFFYRKTRFGFSPLLYSWCAQFAIQALAWRSGPAAVEDLF